MPKRNRLAAIINQLTATELSGLTPADALSLLQTLRQQSINPETDAAIKRVALLLLRDDPADSVPGPTETRLLH
jgi:hypothetical protein